MNRRRAPMPWLLLLACSLIVAAPVLAQEAGPRKDPNLLQTPAKGMFLVATPDMQDPRFREAVILLLRHAEDGSAGLIINRPTDFRLAQAVPDLAGVTKRQDRLFIGGPVGLETVLYLVRENKVPSGAERIMGDVYVSGNRNILEALFAAGESSAKLRVFLGYAGWAPGQLASELAQGTWYVIQGDPKLIFAADPDAVWEDLIKDQVPTGLMVHAPSPAGPA